MCAVVIVIVTAVSAMLIGVVVMLVVDDLTICERTRGKQHKEKTKPLKFTQKCYISVTLHNYHKIDVQLNF